MKITLYKASKEAKVLRVWIELQGYIHLSSSSDIYDQIVGYSLFRPRPFSSRSEFLDAELVRKLSFLTLPYLFLSI
jgi:hypothetical protein